jgi:hypothetical protein
LQPREGLVIFLQAHVKHREAVGRNLFLAR